MSAVLEARAVITAEDRTGKAFDALKGRIAGLTRQIEVMDRVMGTVGQAARAIDAVKLPTGRWTADLGRFTEVANGTSAAIGSVERASAAMSATMARSSSSVGRLTGELSDAQAKLKAIADFKGANRSLDEASLAMRRSQQDVRRLQAEIAGMETPTKSLQGALASAQASAVQAADAFKLEGAAAREARAALDELGVPVGKLRIEEERLTAAAEQAAQALQRQAGAEREAAAAASTSAQAERRAAQASQKAARDHARELAERQAEIRHHGTANFLAMSAAGYVSGHAVVEGIAETARAGAEYQHEVLGLQNAGRTPEEIRAIEARSAEVVGKLPTSSYIDNMKVIAETTQAFGSVEHAMDHLEFMQKAMSVLHAAGGEHIKGGPGEVGRALAKTFEERLTRPEDFEKEASMMIPAMVASGGVFNPEQLYMFAQQAKSALPNYDMRFLSRVAPSLITAMGGERAGTAANAFNSIIMGKVNDKKQAEAWLKAGLLDKDKVIMKAGHAVGWSAGAVKNTDLALRDPLAWAEQVEIPALKAMGIDMTDRLAVAKALGTMYRNQNGNMWATELTQEASRARLHKDEDLYGRVGTADEIYERNRRDPGVQAEALRSALQNLMVTLSSPLMAPAGLALSNIASGIDSFANVLKEHPGLAATGGVAAASGALAGAGWLSYQFMNGFGLGASATALDAAAAEQTAAAVALSGAAAKLGAAGLEHDLAGALPGGRGAARTVIREGEQLAEGAVEAAIGQKVIGAIEGGLKGGVAVEALEVAATGAVTLTAASVGFLGLTAAAVVAGLRASMDPKPRASDKPGFGRPFAPVPGLDLDDPRYRAPEDRSYDEKEQLKPWFNRDYGAHPRGSSGSQQDTQKPGHMVTGRGGVREWVADEYAPLKHAPYFGVAPWGPGGLAVPMPRGMPVDPLDPRTWARIDPRLPLPNPDLYGPADVPLPPERPAVGTPGVERRTLGAYFRVLRHRIAAGADVPDPTPPPPHGGAGGPIPVTIVNPPSVFHDGSAAFLADHEGTIGHRILEHDAEVSPHVDTAGLEAGKTAGGELQSILAAIASMVISPSVNPSGLAAAAATAAKLRTDLEAINRGGSGGTSGSLGTSYPQTAPTGRMGPR